MAQGYGADTGTNPYYPFYPYYGWDDLGPVQVPPLPQAVGLTDATTGVVNYLAIDPTQDNRLVLTPTLPPGFNTNVKVWGPNSGPPIGSSGYSLWLNNGRLILVDQQPGAGPGPMLPVLGTTQYVAVLIVVNMLNKNGIPSGQNINGKDHLTFYFASSIGPILPCNNVIYNCGATQPAS